MTRDELLELRGRLLLGSPPYELDQATGAKKRSSGAAGLEERRSMGDYDASAAGIRMALEICLQLTQHLLDRMKKGT